MERLTGRTDKGFAYLAGVRPDEQAVDSEYPNTLNCILESFERLAAYEETGLAPEEIAALKARLDNAIELPCKVGDTVYIYEREFSTGEWVGITENIVTTITLNAGEKPRFKLTNTNGTYLIEAFGKSIFLTREAAEKAKEVQE